MCFMCFVVERMVGKSLFGGDICFVMMGGGQNIRLILKLNREQAFIYRSGSI